MARYLLYGGKGGVGKTTMAAASGMALADRGAETLVVSTDPAHSLGDAYGVPLTAEPRAVRPGLHAVEVDPERRRDAYRRLFAGLMDELAAVGVRLDEEEVEGLFAAGIVPLGDEVAAMDSFAEYAESARWDRVVLDTAPTGHALRLLALPETVSEAVESTLALRGRLRRLADSARRMVLGPAYYALGGRPESDEAGTDAGPESFEALQARMERARDLLRDPDRTEFRVVVVPETMAIRETERLVDRLRAFEVPVRTLVVNRVLTDVDESCDRCRRRRDAQQERLAEIRRLFPDLSVQVVPELPTEVQGVESLERVAENLDV